LVNILAQMDHIAQSTNELYNSLGATYILKKVNQLPYYTARHQK